MWNTFLKGVNYWPTNKAMYWWKAFDLKEVSEDFNRLRSFNFNVIRFFLNWEEFQPEPDVIDYRLVDHIKRLADLAYDLGLYLMPTFFCGHMSGVNWMPEWLLKHEYSRQRFPVYSNGKLCFAPIRNFYIEEDLIAAQLLQIRIICGALADHPAVLAFDLGNESSNCVIPPDRSSGCTWLKHMRTEIKLASPSSLITLGMHAEDLEENRNIWPQDAAQFCDFLSMHGYPFYLSWVDNPYDYRVLPFLGLITQWLGQKAVLFQEFGAPVLSQTAAIDNRSINYSCPLWDENEAADYYRNALSQLEKAGMLGAMAWCFADYNPVLWNQAPLQDNPHERHFGLFRYDGSAKLSAEVWKDHTSYDVNSAYGQKNTNWDWLNGFNPDQFYNNPQENLARLFAGYKDYWLKGRLHP